MNSKLTRDKTFFKGGVKYVICSKCGAIYNADEAEFCPGCLLGRKFDYSQERKKKKKKKKKLTKEQLRKKRRYDREYAKKRRKRMKLWMMMQEDDLIGEDW